MTIAEKRQQFQILRIVLSISGLLCMGVAIFLYLAKPDLANITTIAAVVSAVGVLDLIIANIILAKKIHQLHPDNNE